MRVDEWVEPSAVGAGGNTIGKSSVTSKVGPVPVKLEVSVSWVMRVDEWVEVRINWWCINIVVVNRLSNRSSLLNRNSNLYRGNRCRCWCLGNKSSSFLTSSSCRHMSTL